MRNMPDIVIKQQYCNPIIKRYKERKRNV